MKVSIWDLSITPGKYKYETGCLDKLARKFTPGKLTPYTVEFVEGEFDKTDAVVFNINRKFDFVFMDLEKIDKRLSRVQDEIEKNLLNRARELLEKETLLCDIEFSAPEAALLKPLSLVSYKPGVGIEVPAADINGVIKRVLDKSSTLLFYTAGKKEVRAWDVKKGQSILEAAAKIHSDLARGFIKAEVINCSQLDSFFNMAEARSLGLVLTVDRDYIMQEGDIIEVRFSV